VERRKEEKGKEKEGQVAPLSLSLQDQFTNQKKKSVTKNCPLSLHLTGNIKSLC